MTGPTVDEFGGVAVDDVAGVDQFGGVAILDSPDVDEFGGVAVRDEGPDELGIGQEVRAVGRALKRGVLRASQAVNALGMDLRQRGMDLGRERLQAAEAAGQTEEAAGLRQFLGDQPARMAQMAVTVAQREKQVQAIPGAPDLANLQTDFWRTFATNPVETVATVVAESLPQAVPGMVAGMAMGPFGVMVGAGLNSFALEYANTILEVAREEKVDLTDPEQANAFFGREDLLATARAKAVRRGLPVAAFDSTTAGIAGRFVKPVLGMGAGRVVVASAKEIGTQAAGGMAGEAAGQLAAEGKITSVPDIVLEGIAELGTAPAEVYGNLRAKPPEDAGQVKVLPDEDELPAPVEQPPITNVSLPETPQSEASLPSVEADLQVTSPDAAAVSPLDVSSVATAGPSDGVATPAQAMRQTLADNPLQSRPAAPEIQVAASAGDAAKASPDAPPADRFEQILDGLKVDTQGKVFDAMAGIPVAVWNSMVEVVRLAYRGGRTLAEATAAGIQWLRDNKHDFDEAQVTEALQSALGERQFASQVDADPTLAAVAPLLTNRLYVRKPNETTAAMAQRIADAVGSVEAAQAVFRDEANGLGGAERTMLGNLVVKRMGESERSARAAGDTGRADQIANEAAVFLDQEVLPRSTDLAQALQAFAAFGALTPQGAVRFARRQFEKASAGVRRVVQPATDRVVDALGAVNREVAEETAKSPAVQAGARKVGDQVVEAAVDTNGTPLREAMTLEVTNAMAQTVGMRQKLKAAALKALQTLGKDTYWGQIVKTSAGSLDAAVKKLLGPEASKALTVSAVAADVTAALRDQLTRTLNMPPGSPMAPPTYFARLKSILQNRQKMDEIWAAARERLLEKYGDNPTMVAALSQDFTAWGPGLLRGLVDEHLKALDVSLRELVTQHYRLKDGVLRDKLVAALGVDPETAVRLAREMDALFAVEFAKAKANLKGRTAKVRRDALLMRAARSGVVDLSALPHSAVDKAIASKLAEVRVQMGRLVREHFTVVDAAGRNLAQRLADEAGLPAAAAAEFAAAIQRRFADLAAIRKQKEIRKIASTATGVPGNAKAAWRRLVELSNLGALSNEAAWKAVQAKLGLPVWSRVIAAKIMRAADEVQRTPEGVIRDRKVIEMLNAVQQAQGVNPADLAMGIWYANILSGPITQVRNALGNVLNLAANITIGLRQPQHLPAQLVALARGLKRGALDAADVLITGQVTGSRNTKHSASATLENVRPEGRLDWMLMPFRLPARMLSAGDMLFFRGGQEMRTALLARQMAKREGLKGADLERRVSEITGDLPARRADAEAQASREGLTGLDWQRRVWDILEQGRPEDMRQNARDYALRLTFNQEPYGLIGAIAKGINWTSHQPWGKPVRLVVPFTNIIANVVNEGLSYFPPVGMARAMWGHWKGELEGKPITDPNAVADQYAKAALGTVLLGVIFAAAEGGADEEDTWFQVTGAGPALPARRNQLRQQGWTPNSIRLGGRWYSFAMTPLAIPLAAMGNYFDAVRYGKMGERDAMTRLGYAAATFFDVILSQSFLSGAADLVSALDRNSENRGADWIKGAVRTAGSFVIPNALRQIDRIFDPTVYDSKDAEAALTSSIPFARRLGRPAINVWGEPVRNPQSRQFSSPVVPDPILSALAKHNLWVSAPQESSTVINGIPVTNQEFYELIRLRGQYMRQQLGRPDRLRFLQGAATPAAEVFFRDIQSSAWERAKAQVARARAAASRP